MSIASSDLVLLDTNVLIHWVRQNPIGVFIRTKYALDSRVDRPLFSTIAEGEILGLAKHWDWGESKIKSLTQLLNEVVRVDAGLPEIVSAYALLYWENLRQGRGTGENDLWIAATAKATGAVLLTCDKDYQWLAPTLLRVEYIPPTT